MIDMKKTISLLLTVCLFSINALAYGPRGHHLVGAIADKRLAKNQAVAQKVRDLLDGLTLEEVATFPDEIKSWDNCDPKRKPSKKPVTDKKRINDELRAFLNANPCSGKPSHHEFHFTDVPVEGNEKYADGQVGNKLGVGRNEFDVVHMITFCIRVLKGEEPETNARAITKSVAVILLAHYLGDIHQPLHVGAEYFKRVKDKKKGVFVGVAFEPPNFKTGYADQGGNKLTLSTFATSKKLMPVGKFHGYWDGKTVDKAFGIDGDDAAAAQQLAGQEPDNWQLTGDPETWAEQMANDIMPLAREAHDRLTFAKIVFPAKRGKGYPDIVSGNANEKKKTGGEIYADWSADVVKKEIQKGGWRLAALLEEIVQ
jgi:hypothetical protein